MADNFAEWEVGRPMRYKPEILHFKPGKEISPFLKHLGKFGHQITGQQNSYPSACSLHSDLSRIAGALHILNPLNTVFQIQQNEEIYMGEI
ncbi:hypothetical protein AVEN_272673-1 [Araneus ventricosus]|uniref:Uncharacterized protein n=1 Tax=Araneus ventricosus TaxID=182803 RepID=A0A4Y2NN97_ARAVE|nr:hypothetical protein AVEN_272673-1 [Araneus ventricosus]